MMEVISLQIVGGRLGSSKEIIKEKYVDLIKSKNIVEEVFMK